MDKEESFLKNRFSDLANSSYNRNIYTYTDFLNLNEISILNSYKNQLPPVNVELAGGNDYAERRIAVFSPEDIYYTQDLPIKLIEIAPINSHYADKLSHRDVLGAILNLGIVRNKIGDIFLKDNQAYVYCVDDISGYIAENLKKIKHTIVKCTVKNMEAVNITPFIESGKVFVNGKMVTSNGHQPKPNDIISVRGKGRFIFEGQLGVTKKGRNLISIKLYI